MKDRATVVCRRDDKILLVARDSARWALPGGTIRRVESPFAAAQRELHEETGLIVGELAYLFEFGGVNKRHHVFCVGVDALAVPEPRNEIVQCAWFSVPQIGDLATSVPTREIVALYLRHADRCVVAPAPLLFAPSGG